MKLRSPISLELVSQGYVRGTKEFKAAYQRELRKRPEVREKERARWKRYYEKKKKEAGGEWCRSRIKQWRVDNPGDWKIISDRATANGVHRRFYQNHKSRILEEKKEYAKQKRRKEPTFGLRKAIAEARREHDIGRIIEECESRIARFDEKS